MHRALYCEVWASAQGLIGGLAREVTASWGGGLTQLQPAL
jgi:hypothetical protein